MAVRHDNIYAVRFPYSLPTTIDRFFFNKILAEFGSYLSRHQEVEQSYWMRIVRIFRRRENDKLSPELVGTEKINYLPIDQLAEQSMRSRVSWIEEKSYIFSPFVPPSKYLRVPFPLTFTEYKREAVPFIDLCNNIEYTTLFIKLYSDTQVIPQIPGRYAVVVGVGAPPSQAEGDDYIKAIATFLNTTENNKYIADELWTMVAAKPLTPSEIITMQSNWEKAKKWFNVGKNPLEQAMLEKVEEVLRDIGRDSSRTILHMKTYFVVFADNMVKAEHLAHVLQEIMGGWGTNQSKTMVAKRFSEFFPNHPVVDTRGDYLLTSDMFVALGFLHGTDANLGNMYMGNVYSYDKLPLSRFDFDPIEVGSKNIAGVTNYLVGITGQQGSGKSFFIKSMLMNLRRKYPDNKLRIRIIDTTGEYTVSDRTQGSGSFVHAIGGESFVVSMDNAGKEIAINPFEIPEEEWEKPDKRLDAIYVTLSSIDTWFQIAFKDYPEALNQIGILKDYLISIYHYGKPIDVKNMPGENFLGGRVPTPLFVFSVEKAFDKAFELFWALKIEEKLTKEEANAIIKEYSEEEKNALLALVEMTNKYREELRRLKSDKQAFYKFTKEKYFSVPRYRVPVMEDLYKMISTAVDYFGRTELAVVRSALARFVSGPLAKIVNQPYTTLPSIDTPVLSIFVSDEGDFGVTDRMLLYILLLNKTVEDILRFQRKHINDPAEPYYMLILDEFWRILNQLQSESLIVTQSTQVLNNIFETLSRDTRKYRVSVLYASQARADIFGDGSSPNPLRTSVLMRFYGAGERAEETALSKDVIPSELQGVYNRIIAMSGTNEPGKDKLFLMDTPGATAIVRVNASKHEAAYAKVIQQGLE